jgi:choline kinase
MKIVFLIAGKGRRLKKVTENNHKALINLDDNSLLHHLIENCIYAGLNDFVPIIGHCADKIVKEFSEKYSKNIKTTYVINEEYSTKNNLHSLFCAKHILKGQDFILCNADIVCDRHIIKEMSGMESLSSIAVDDFEYLQPIDSPGIYMQDGKISDLGRHIKFSENMGYAIGIYKFNKELSSAFFDEAEKLLDRDSDAGFHDPLPELFNRFDVYKYQTEGKLWTDIDTFDDIEKAKGIHRKIKEGYARYD